MNQFSVFLGLAAFGAALTELDEGTYDIKADLSFISVCTERDRTIESVYGESYTWTF